MPRIVVKFSEDELPLEIPEDRLIAAWQGPIGMPPAERDRALEQALEHPLDFPGLRQAVVPGDRIVIPIGPGLDDISTILKITCGVLSSADVAPEGVTVLADIDMNAALMDALPSGVVLESHDPEDRTRLAYLATTAEGRRVYLNRALTDADFVLPLGGLYFDPIRGIKGPWSAIYPGSSDQEARTACHSVEAQSRKESISVADSPSSREAEEVCWLLGSQFQIGVMPGILGAREVVAGLATSVIRAGSSLLEKTWGVRVAARAELVVVGAGRPGRPTDLDDLARGLATGTRLVQRGGKVVLLSRASGVLSQAVGALRGLDSPREAAALLKGWEALPDYPAARQLVASLAWADVYLFSDLDPDDVESLGMIRLDRPAEVTRLVAMSGSSTVVSDGDRAMALVTD